MLSPRLCSASCLLKNGPYQRGAGFQVCVGLGNLSCEFTSSAGNCRSATYLGSRAFADAFLCDPPKTCARRRLFSGPSGLAGLRCWPQPRRAGAGQRAAPLGRAKPAQTHVRFRRCWPSPSLRTSPIQSSLQGPEVFPKGESGSRRPAGQGISQCRCSETVQVNHQTSPDSRGGNMGDVAKLQ